LSIRIYSIFRFAVILLSVSQQFYLPFHTIKSGVLDEWSTCSILENMGSLLGASLKDLGKKLFAFSKMETKPAAILKGV